MLRNLGGMRTLGAVCGDVPRGLLVFVNFIKMIKNTMELAMCAGMCCILQ